MLATAMGCSYCASTLRFRARAVHGFSGDRPCSNSRRKLEGSPLVIDNVAYVAAKQGALVALDATSGKELWVHSFPASGGGAGAGRGGGIAGQRGANYWESKDRADRRIFVTTGGFLHAIDARTGKLVESFADHGRLDLKTGIDRTTGVTTPAESKSYVAFALPK
jgi:glucose dehydrogenase